jgi:hypothetical protein
VEDASPIRSNALRDGGARIFHDIQQGEQGAPCHDAHHQRVVGSVWDGFHRRNQRLDFLAKELAQVVEVFAVTHPPRPWAASGFAPMAREEMPDLVRYLRLQDIGVLFVRHEPAAVVAAGSSALPCLGPLRRSALLSCRHFVVILFFCWTVDVRCVCAIPPGIFGFLSTGLL